MKTFALTLLFLFSLNAHAGQEVGNGGDVLLCPGKEPVVLDYYVATLRSPGEKTREIVDISKWSFEEVVEFFKLRFRDSDFGDRFASAIRVFSDRQQWVVVNGLRDINDEGMDFKIPTGCQLIQTAVRFGNQIYVEEAVIEQLSSAQVGLLAVHEALYSIAVANGKMTSETTRQVVRATLWKTEDRVAIKNAVNSLGSRFLHHESVTCDYFTLYDGLGDIREVVMQKQPHDDSLFSAQIKVNEFRGMSMTTLLSFRGYLRCDAFDLCVPVHDSESAPAKDMSLQLLRNSKVLLTVPGFPTMTLNRNINDHPNCAELK